MKKNLYSLLVALLCMITSATANPVGRNQAQKSAIEFLNRQKASGGAIHMPSAPVQLHEVASIAPARTDTTAAYYVFNVGQENGFVIVSGDDETPAILGYSNEGSIQSDNIPENMQAWLKEYENQLQWIESHRDGTSPLPRLQLRLPDQERPALDPLVNSTWNQGAPYNDLCPDDPDTGDKCVTGCVATAMAQAIYYHRYPKATRAVIPAYNYYNLGTNKDLYVPEMEISAIDWNNLLPNYNGSESTAEKNAVAKLMRLCGQSVRMMYSSDGSGAYTSDVPIALREYFGFASSTRYVTRSNYRRASWEKLIYDEIADGRPVIYSGQSMGGGHEFIVDGYDGNGLFHLNWGWGSSCDGWFVLSILNPGSNEGIGASSSNDGFAFDQEAVIGMTPDEGLEPDELLTAYSMTINGDTIINRNPRTKNFKINISGEFYNMTGQTRGFNVGIGIMSSSGEMLETKEFFSYSLDNYTGWNNYVFEANMGKTLTDGSYMIVLTSCPNIYVDGLQPDYGSSNCYIEAIISDNVMTLSYPKLDVSGEINTSGLVLEGIPVTLDCTVTNNKSPMAKDVYLLIDDNPSGGQYVELGRGQQITMHINIGELESGSHTAKLAFWYWEYNSEDDVWNRHYDVFGSYEFDVEENNGTTRTIQTEATIEPLSSGMLQQPNLIFTALAKNETNKVFKGWIAQCLYMEKEGSGYDFYDYQVTYVTLAPGETKTLECEFKNLPTNKNFGADIEYYVDDRWYTNSNTVWFTTDYVLETTNNTDIDISIDNLDEDIEIHSSIVSGTIKLTNNNVYTDYCDRIWVTLQKYNWATHEWEFQTSDVPMMNIPAGSSQVLRFRFDKLYNEANYGIAVFYQRDAEYLYYEMKQFIPRYESVYGDADCSGKVNHLDISTIINAINSDDLDVRNAADVNKDGVVNIADIIFTSKRIR